MTRDEAQAWFVQVLPGTVAHDERPRVRIRERTRRTDHGRA